MSWTWWDSDGMSLNVSHLFSSVLIVLSEHAGIQVDLCCRLSARHDLEVRVEQQHTETGKMHVQKYPVASGIPLQTSSRVHTTIPPTCWWTRPLLLPVAEKGYHLKPGLTSVWGDTSLAALGFPPWRSTNGGWGALAFKKGVKLCRSTLWLCARPTSFNRGLCVSTANVVSGSVDGVSSQLIVSASYLGLMATFPRFLNAAGSAWENVKWWCIKKESFAYAFDPIYSGSTIWTEWDTDLCANASICFELD